MRRQRKRWEMGKAGGRKWKWTGVVLVGCGVVCRSKCGGCAIMQEPRTDLRVLAILLQPLPSAQTAGPRLRALPLCWKSKARGQTVSPQRGNHLKGLAQTNIYPPPHTLLFYFLLSNSRNRIVNVKKVLMKHIENYGIPAATGAKLIVKFIYYCIPNPIPINIT